MHESIQHVAASLGFSTPIISYNGAMLRMPDGELLHHEPLEASVSRELVEECEARELPLNFYQSGRLISRRFQPWWDLYEGRTASPMQAVESLLPYRHETATKLLVMSPPQRIRELEAEFAPRFAGRANVLITGDEYLEFMAPTVNKGAALRVLAGRLGIAREQIVAAGDGYNDVEMLREAGLGLAVEGGRQAAKDAAGRVVAGPAQGGVAHFIETELLGGS
jgi:Cof subfamily protein (haloacid dehalogenase superfamily)